MKLDELKLDHLKQIAREHKLKGFSTMKKPEILKHVRKHLGARVKVVNGRPTMEGKGKKDRCWEGYQPVKGKKPFSKGSCEKSEGGSIIATSKGGDGEVSDRLRKLVDRLKGGTIQVAEGNESVTNTEGGSIRMPIRGGTIVNPACSPDCVEPPACKKKKRAAVSSVSGFDPASGIKQKQYKDCKDEEREKMNCPADCKKAEGPSDAMKAALAVTDVLTKITNKGIAAAFTLGKPAFFAACTAAGGPAGTAACKTLYDKMIKDPGYEKGMMDKASFSATELKLLEKIGNVRDDKIKGSAIQMPMAGGSVEKDDEDEDPIDWDDIKWGSFTEQLKQYNKRHKNKFTGDKALCDFADMILSNKSKYSTTTKRRASFYLNVLAKKKCG